MPFKSTLAVAPPAVIKVIKLEEKPSLGLMSPSVIASRAAPTVSNEMAEIL